MPFRLLSACIFFFGTQRLLSRKKGRKIRREKLGKRKSAERELGCHSRRDRWLVLFFSSFFSHAVKNGGRETMVSGLVNSITPNSPKTRMQCNRGTTDFPAKKNLRRRHYRKKAKLKVQTDAHIHDSIRQKIRINYSVPFFLGCPSGLFPQLFTVISPVLFLIS